MRMSPQEAMRSPAFYPDRPHNVEVVETHISWVFLAGDRAYKLRKPVVFPFLDYGTAERRRVMCEQEVRLGRRLAPDAYRGPAAAPDDGRMGARSRGRGRRRARGRDAAVGPAHTLAALLRGDAADEATVRAVARPAHRP
jgi:hypothetical protein